ncbi:MAG: hypothetical protein V2I51_23710 [Anderseniella sp.]|jgi:hypothetical protein|nr:hypothetical protein [Anderseniella sp.]
MKSKNLVAGDLLPVQTSTVRVSVPASVAYNLGRMQEATKEILGRLGCENCHSGYDIRFDIIRDYKVRLAGNKIEVFEATPIEIP